MATLKMCIKNDSLPNTPISNIFIDEYMPHANAMYSLVYILGFRHCLQGGEGIDIKEISKTLHILDSDVINAWKHWEKEGIIKILDNSVYNFSIEFYPIEKKDEKDNLNGEKNSNIKIKLASQPSYSPKEIDIYMERSQEIRNLFKIAERIFGKPLTYSELNMILSFFEWYDLPIDVIEIMLEYCVSNNKKGKNYLETVARDWSENGINSVEDANDYIETFNGYNKILRAFGITGKTPNKKQTAFMKKWLEEYKLPFDVIIEACETAFLQTGKAKFEYADTILKEWAEKQIDSLEAVNKANEEFKTNKKFKIIDNAKYDASIKPAYKNRFINYEQREWNYDEIEKLALEKLK